MLFSILDKTAKSEQTEPQKGNKVTVTVALSLALWQKANIEANSYKDYSRSSLYQWG